MSREFGPRYSEGHDVEEGVLGKINPEAAFEIEKRKNAMEDYITFAEALDIVKKSQPFKDPSDPHEKPFPYDVHATVAKTLELENFEQLRYYTAVRSKLDFFHGVDAFLELQLPDGRTLRVDMDMTTNPQKMGKEHRILVEWPKDGLNLKDPEDKNIFKHLVKKTSGDIVDGFTGQAESNGLIIRSMDLEELQRSRALAAREEEQLVQHARKHQRKGAHAR